MRIAAHGSDMREYVDRFLAHPQVRDEQSIVLDRGLHEVPGEPAQSRDSPYVTRLVKQTPVERVHGEIEPVLVGE